jgi:hypothetical protein
MGAPDGCGRGGQDCLECWRYSRTTYEGAPRAEPPTRVVEQKGGGTGRGENIHFICCQKQETETGTTDAQRNRTQNERYNTLYKKGVIPFMLIGPAPSSGSRSESDASSHALSIILPLPLVCLRVDEQMRLCEVCSTPGRRWRDFSIWDGQYLGYILNLRFSIPKKVHLRSGNLFKLTLTFIFLKDLS